MALGLQTIIDDCESNDDVRAIVIKGNGQAFCAGQDL
jgi:2-(1,2-epoxy-1,2-dihydrophenyl)acetyl-CoA isomerase